MNTDLPPSALHPAFVYRGNPEEIEPTEQEVHEYAEWLGIDLVKEAHLLYIARKGIVAPLPEGWQACRSSAGEMYYFNLVTAESLREHPLDVHYKNMVALKRRNLEHSSAAHEPSSENLQDVSPKFSSAAQWHPVHQGCSPDSFSGSQSSPQSASTGVTEPRRTQKDALLEKMPAESNAKHAEQVELLWHSVQRLEGLLAKEESMRQAAEDALWTATERQQLLTLALTDAQKLISRSKKASSSSATVGFAAMAAMAAAAGVALLLSSRR